MLSYEQVAAFKADGFLNAGPVLSAAEVDELLDELARVLEEAAATAAEPATPSHRRPVLARDLSKVTGPEGARPVWQIVNIWEASEPYRRLLYHPSIVTGIAQLTEASELQIWHDQIQYKPGNGGCLQWHQDATAWPPLEPMNEVSAWVALDDVDVDNGAMWMVPGSYMWGPQTEFLQTRQHLTTTDDFAQVADGFRAPGGAVPDGAAPGRAVVAPPAAVPRPVKRGELHFHHALTWHGSPANDSSRPRRAIAIYYMTGDARFTGRAGRDGKQHVMAQFVEVPPGGRMMDAGPHFPIVARGGEPVPAGPAPGPLPAGAS